MTSKLTREQVIALIAEHSYDSALVDALEYLLAAMDSEPVAEITEDLGRLFVKIHYPTTLRAGDKLYLHAQTATAGEPVLWAWQHLDMWHVTSHHGRARDLGLSGFKVIPLYRHAQPAQVVPDGYVMVPKEPTEEMLQASYREAAVYSPTAYRAMIAAALQEGKQ